MNKNLNCLTINNCIDKAFSLLGRERQNTKSQMNIIEILVELYSRQSQKKRFVSKETEKIGQGYNYTT